MYCGAGSAREQVRCITQHAVLRAGVVCCGASSAGGQVRTVYYGTGSTEEPCTADYGAGMSDTTKRSSTCLNSNRINSNPVPALIPTLDKQSCVITSTLFEMNSTCMRLCDLNFSCLSTSITSPEVFSCKNLKRNQFQHSRPWLHFVSPNTNFVNLRQ